MKRLFLLIICLHLFSAGISSAKNKQETIAPAKNRSAYSLDVREPITNISLSGTHQLIFTQSTDGASSVKYSIPTNFEKMYTVEVTGNELYVGVLKGGVNLPRVNTREPVIIVEVSSPSLESLCLMGASEAHIKNALDIPSINVSTVGKCRVAFDELTAGSAVFNLVGDSYLCALRLIAGDLSGTVASKAVMDLKGTVENANMTMAGFGEVDATRLDVKNLTTVIAGQGRFAGNVTQNFVATVAGNGEITVSGNCQTSNMTIAGGGKINGIDLTSKKVTAVINGKGRLFVRSSEEVNLSVFGNGQATVAGECATADLTVAGNGIVAAKNLIAESVKGSIAGGGQLYAHCTRDINMTITSSGRLLLTGHAGDANFTVMSRSTLEAAGFEADNLYLSLAGKGRAETGMTKSATVHASSSSRAVLHGKADEIELQAASSSIIDARKVDSAGTTATVSGKAKIYCTANVDLIGETNSKGKIYYRGDPESAHFTGKYKNGKNCKLTFK